jgi:hypothetical protein
MDFNLKLLTKHKISDVLRIYLDQVVSFVWYHLYKKGRERSIKSPDGYTEVFSDNFTGELDLNEWRYGMPWGSFHPDNLTQYYDTDGKLSRITDEGIALDIRNWPKTFYKKDLPEWQQTSEMPEVFTIPVGVGYISTKRSWKYGWFEAWIKIPKGQHYWHAFWTSGAYSWPPEIDIFEGYSDASATYGGNRPLKLTNRKIQPNLHYGIVENGTKAAYGTYNNQIADLTERYVQFVCHWEEDHITIYYDGHRVFECTEEKVLDWFNKDNSDQFIIFNHGVSIDYPLDPEETSMVVKNFRILQRKNP